MVCVAQHVSQRARQRPAVRLGGHGRRPPDVVTVPLDRLEQPAHHILGVLHTKRGDCGVALAERVAQAGVFRLHAEERMVQPEHIRQGLRRARERLDQQRKEEEQEEYERIAKFTKAREEKEKVLQKILADRQAQSKEKALAFSKKQQEKVAKIQAEWKVKERKLEELKDETEKKLLAVSTTACGRL